MDQEARSVQNSKDVVAGKRRAIQPMKSSSPAPRAPAPRQLRANSEIGAIHASDRSCPVPPRSI